MILLTNSISKKHKEESCQKITTVNIRTRPTLQLTHKLTQLLTHKTTLHHRRMQ